MTLASQSRIPDQLKWAEYIGVSIVAQFLLFPHVEGEVLEGNLLSGVDCVIQGFHDVIDFLVAGILRIIWIPQIIRRTGIHIF